MIKYVYYDLNKYEYESDNILNLYKIDKTFFMYFKRLLQYIYI